MASQIPDELLSVILSYLCARELLCVERVCTRWLMCSSKLWTRRRRITVSDGVPLRQVASKLLDSQHLRELCISNYYPASQLTESITLMARSTPQLRCIALRDCEISNELLRAVANGWPALEQVEVTYLTGSHEHSREYPLQPDFDIGLQQLFSTCRVLHTVRLHLDRLPEPSLIQQLPVGTMRELSLRAYFYRAEFFEDLFAVLYTMSNLECLGLHFIFDQHITNWWPEHAMLEFLEKLSRNAPKISKIRMMFAEHFFRQTTPLWHFATACRHFAHLQSIDLSDNSGLETRDLQIIGLYCQQIRSLDLSHAKLGTEQGLDYIVGCSKLSTLNISGTKFYDFDTRTYLPISSVSIKFLDRMPSIECLYVNECVGLTPKSLYVALHTMVKLGALHSVHAKMVHACNHDFVAALYAAVNPNQVSSSQCGRWLCLTTDSLIANTSPLLRSARGISPDPTCRGIVVRPVSRAHVQIVLAV